jgi:hypothetical protein
LRLAALLLQMRLSNYNGRIQIRNNNMWEFIERGYFEGI